MKGVGFVNENPEGHSFKFFSHNFGEAIFAPPMTQDDGFNSHPMTGTIAYRTPSLWDLFGMERKAFDNIASLTFTVSVFAHHELLEEPRELTCKNEAYCKLEYRQHYTPSLWFVSPRVVYSGAKTEFWFDPRSTPNLIQGLMEEDKLFINARVSGALMDFEESVTHTTRFSNWRKNRVRGEVGELPIADNHTISMLWETGQSEIVEHTAKYCTYGNETCYYAKSVPVIKNMVANEGYYTGGQNLTLNGHGFAQGNISVTVDGIDCIVSEWDADSINCEVQPREDGVSTVGEPVVGAHGVRWKYVPGNSLSNVGCKSCFDAKGNTEELIT